MSLEIKIETLRSEIKKSLSVLARIENYILTFQKQILKNSPGLDEACATTSLT